MRPLLLDTNAYSAYKRGDPDATQVLDHATDILINVVGLAELLGGFGVGSRGEAVRQELAEFLHTQSVRVLVIDSDTAELYAQIYRELRLAGTPIPQNDMWIAATARQHDLMLFTFDAHFRSVPRLVVGQVLSDFKPSPGTDMPT